MTSKVFNSQYIQNKEIIMNESMNEIFKKTTIEFNHSLKNQKDHVIALYIYKLNNLYEIFVNDDICQKLGIECISLARVYLESYAKLKFVIEEDGLKHLLREESIHWKKYSNSIINSEAEAEEKEYYLKMKDKIEKNIDEEISNINTEQIINKTLTNDPYIQYRDLSTVVHGTITGISFAAKDEEEKTTIFIKYNINIILNLHNQLYEMLRIVNVFSIKS